MLVRVRQHRVFSPPIGFSERIAVVAVIRRRVAHIVSFVVVVVVSLLDCVWKTRARRRVVGSECFRSCSSSSSSSSLSSRRAFSGIASSRSLSLFLPLALVRVGQTDRSALLFVVFEEEISPRRPEKTLMF